MLNGDPTPLAGWLRILLGGVLLIWAWRIWRNRPSSEMRPAKPTFLAGVDSYSGFKTMLMGVTLSALNPKSFVLTSATAVMIYEAKIAGRQKALTLIIFSFIASLSVGLPIA